MRKSDLADIVSEKSGISKQESKVVVDVLIEALKNAIKLGEEVQLRGFGTLKAKERKAKIGRDISKNVAINIPASFVPTFKPAKEFIESVKKAMAPSFDK